MYQTAKTETFHKRRIGEKSIHSGNSGKKHKCGGGLEGKLGRLGNEADQSVPKGSEVCGQLGVGKQHFLRELTTCRHPSGPPPPGADPAEVTTPSLASQL